MMEGKIWQKALRFRFENIVESGEQQRGERCAFSHLERHIYHMFRWLTYDTHGVPAGMAYR